MWTFPNLKLGVKKMWQGNRLHIKRLRWNPMHPVNQTAREVQKRKGQNGHTFYTCLQPQSTIRKPRDGQGDLRTRTWRPYGWPGRWDHQGLSITGGGLVKVPNLRVCKTPMGRSGTRRGEGRINVLPWYCLVGVAKTSSETQRRKNRTARNGKWSPRGTGDESPHLSWSAHK